MHLRTTTLNFEWLVYYIIQWENSLSVQKTFGHNCTSDANCNFQGMPMVEQCQTLYMYFEDVPHSLFQAHPKKKKKQTLRCILKYICKVWHCSTVGISKHKNILCTSALGKIYMQNLTLLNRRHSQAQKHFMHQCCLQNLYVKFDIAQP